MSDDETSEQAAVTAGEETSETPPASAGDHTSEAPPASAGDHTSEAPPASAGELAGATGPARPNRRKVREGLVLSVAMDKTAVIGVIERVRHPRYAKTVQRTKRLYADDPNNDLRVGDRVRLAETRPLSRLKRWRVVDVLERAR
jgi:small subunit ribosomal protein S17